MKTSENFRALCTGEKGIGKQGKLLSYRYSVLHRVVPNFIIQGGDIINKNGTGGESIYGQYFEDENFTNKHNEPFLLSMANSGKNKNSSQFFITLAPLPHLDGVNVVFGKVTSGQEIVRGIASLGSAAGATQYPISILNCG